MVVLLSNSTDSYVIKYQTPPFLLSFRVSHRAIG